MIFAEEVNGLDYETGCTIDEDGSSEHESTEEAIVPGDTIPINE